MGIEIVKLITRGIILHAAARRRAMTVAILAAAALLFAGATFAAGFLRERPLLFIVYWFFCGWMTLVSVLLALYDMLALRRSARHARHALQQRILGRDAPPDEPADRPGDPE